VGGIVGVGVLTFGLWYCWHYLRSSRGCVSFYLLGLVDFFISRATMPRFKVLITFYRASLALDSSTSGCLVAVCCKNFRPRLIPRPTDRDAPRQRSL
jgi:hypothetical protein